MRKLAWLGLFACSAWAGSAQAKLVQEQTVAVPTTIIDALGGNGELKIPAVYVFDEKGQGLLEEAGMQQVGGEFDESSLKRFNLVLQDDKPAQSRSKAAQAFKSALKAQGFDLIAPEHTRQVLVVDLDASLLGCGECDQAYPRFKDAASKQFVPVRWIRLVLTKPKAAPQP